MNAYRQFQDQLFDGTPLERLRNITSHMTDWYRRVLMHDPCVYCGSDATGLDHIRPRSSYEPAPNSKVILRWMNGWENRAPSCARCDSAKGAQSMLLFLWVINRQGLPSVSKAQQARQERLRKVQRLLMLKY